MSDAPIIQLGDGYYTDCPDVTLVDTKQQFTDIYPVFLNIATQVPSWLTTTESTK